MAIAMLHLKRRRWPLLLTLLSAMYIASVAVLSTTDCSLLRRAFTTSKLSWQEEEKTAVSGFATWRTCGNWKIIDPGHCDRSLPQEMVYDRSANPQGVRCDLYTNNVNMLGRDPKTGLVRRPLDNVGVQYGLGALQSGLIDAEMKTVWQQYRSEPNR